MVVVVLLQPLKLTGEIPTAANAIDGLDRKAADMILGCSLSVPRQLS